MSGRGPIGCHRPMGPGAQHSQPQMRPPQQQHQTGGHSRNPRTSAPHRWWWTSGSQDNPQRVPIVAARRLVRTPAQQNQEPPTRRGDGTTRSHVARPGFQSPSSGPAPGQPNLSRTNSPRPADHARPWESRRAGMGGHPGGTGASAAGRSRIRRALRPENRRAASY